MSREQPRRREGFHARFAASWRQRRRHACWYSISQVTQGRSQTKVMRLIGKVCGPSSMIMETLTHDALQND